MTGDQWYSLLKLVIILAFAALVLYGLYRIAVSDKDKHKNKDE